PEMKSTGEVMGVGDTFGEAFGKATLATNVKIPRSGNVIISVKERDKPKAVELARKLQVLGFTVFSTSGTAAYLGERGINVSVVNKVKEGRPHMVDMIKNDEVQFIVNSTEGRQATADSALIRRSALLHKVYYTTTLEGAAASVAALEHQADSTVRKLQDLHK